MGHTDVTVPRPHRPPPPAELASQIPALALALATLGALAITLL